MAGVQTNLAGRWAALGVSRRRLTCLWVTEGWQLSRGGPSSGLRTWDPGAPVSTWDVSEGCLALPPLCYLLTCQGSPRSEVPSALAPAGVCQRLLSGPLP